MALGPGPVWPRCPLHPCRRHCTSTPVQHTRRQRRLRHHWWRVPLPHSVSSSSSSSSSSEDETSGCYHSDTETNMPGGYENSAMKTSFSLSSLQPSSASLESPEHARLVKPFNSLRKSARRDFENERRERKEDTNDEFWNALEPNYLYLMDSNLIDSCKEAKQDLHYGVSLPMQDWSFDEFCNQYTELDSWLTSIQIAFFSRKETDSERNLRLRLVDEMHRKTYERKVYNNQGGRLALQHPELRELVRCNVALLNRKWERLELTLTPRKRSHPDTQLMPAIDIEHELNLLKKWLRSTERRLQPLNFHVLWTPTELKVKKKEHQTGSVEGQTFLKTQKLVSLSEQNLVDCSSKYGNQGCMGGLMDSAFEYIIANKGIDTEASYPYTGEDGKCHYKAKSMGATISSYVDVESGSESDLQKAVANVGPISVAMDASQVSFQLYAGGVYTPSGCSTDELDHGVLAVGYGTLKKKAYWLIKNSWGTEWGLSGYFMMARNHKNMCGVATMASYPVV